VISSLQILCFPHSDYKVAAPTTASFDGTNEKLFLSLVHFLLSLLHPQFAQQAKQQGIFPYTNVKEKNAFRSYIQSTLATHVSSGELPAQMARSSLLLMAKGKATWDLLWYLTDLAFDSINGMGYKTIRLESELEQIRSISQALQLSRIERLKYAHELEERFRTALKSIDRSKKRLQLAVAEDRDRALSGKGKLTRTENMGRIDGSITLLKNMLDRASILVQPELKYIPSTVDGNVNGCKSKHTYRLRESLFQPVASLLAKRTSSMKQIQSMFEDNNMIDLEMQILHEAYKAAKNCADDELMTLDRRIEDMAALFDR